MKAILAQAIAFEVPQTLSVQTSGLTAFENGAVLRLVTPHDRGMRWAPELGPKAVMGRLLARIGRALGCPAPTVGETLPVRRAGSAGYACIDLDEDLRKGCRAIHDVSGDRSILARVTSRLAPGGEVVLAGFDQQGLPGVTALAERGALLLAGLVTHTLNRSRTREACEPASGNPQCLRMTMDGRA